MIEVIPAINADSFEEIKRRIKLVELHVNPAVGGAGWVQLDVCDGTFTANTTWHNPEDLLAFETPLKIEVHLMISDIEKKLENWLLPNVQRIIFNLEAAKDADFVIEKCHANPVPFRIRWLPVFKAKREVGIAIGPDTSWTRLVPYFNKADLFQILGVQPGLAGQKFNEECFDKIIHLRKSCRRCIIEVDGGMNRETARRAASAGANIINAASYIFDAPDIKTAIEELKNFEF